jgi:2-polyprenyl-3-methyl-5-hydroxy-6-metoxy-1,4-benzoquinol methylase
MLTVTIDCLPDCCRGRVHFSANNQIWLSRVGMILWAQMTKPMTSVAHWDGVWSRVPSMRLPSRLFVTTQDRMRLLRRYLKPGMRFLELGCAPAKMLAWVATQGVQVAGMDYSAQGIEWGCQLMRALGLEADLWCEDLFSTTFSRESFDLVHSAGLVEHFDDPLPLVKIHLDLVPPEVRF